jgi:hypothetical protein
MALINFFDSRFRSRRNTSAPNSVHRERREMAAPIQSSPDAAELGLKSPHSLSMENSSLHTSPQSFHQPLTNADQDEGDNSNAFAVALDPGMAPAEDAALFYKGKSPLKF